MSPDDFEQRVARRDAEAGQRALEQKHRDDELHAVRRKLAADVESAVDDLVAFLQARITARRVRVRGRRGLLTPGLSSPDGWLIEYWVSGYGGLSNVWVLTPDGALWEYYSSYGGRTASTDLARHFAEHGRAELRPYTFEVNGDQIRASKLSGHDTVNVPYLDAFAEVAENAVRLAFDGFPPDLKL